MQYRQVLYRITLIYQSFSRGSSLFIICKLRKISAPFQHRLKFVCCDFYMKKYSFYSYIFCFFEIRWLFISSKDIWVTGSDNSSVASRARRKMTRSKFEWNYNLNYLECRWNDPCWNSSKLTTNHELRNLKMEGGVSPSLL